MNIKTLVKRTDPTRSISSRAIDFGEVLAGEGSSTMSTPTTISVDNDLSSSQASVTLGSTDDEAARGLDLYKW